MDTVKIDARDVNFWYGDFHALKGISMQIEEKSVVAFIGPSGCGKSTFLRLFNRMNDLIPATRLEGEIRIDGLQFIFHFIPKRSPFQRFFHPLTNECIILHSIHTKSISHILEDTFRKRIRTLEHHSHILTKFVHFHSLSPG